MTPVELPSTTLRTADLHALLAAIIYSGGKTRSTHESIQLALDMLDEIGDNVEYCRRWRRGEGR